MDSLHLRKGSSVLLVTGEETTIPVTIVNDSPAEATLHIRMKPATPQLRAQDHGDREGSGGGDDACRRPRRRSGQCRCADHDRNGHGRRWGVLPRQESLMVQGPRRLGEHRHGRDRIGSGRRVRDRVDQDDLARASEDPRAAAWPTPWLAPRQTRTKRGSACPASHPWPSPRRS
jgi:hypothetical protein